MFGQTTRHIAEIRNFKERLRNYRNFLIFGADFLRILFLIESFSARYYEKQSFVEMDVKRANKREIEGYMPKKTKQIFFQFDLFLESISRTLPLRVQIRSKDENIYSNSNLLPSPINSDRESRHVYKVLS